MKRTAILVAAMALASNAASEPPFPVVAKLEGIAGVKDGDGILFGDEEVRLPGYC